MKPSTGENEMGLRKIMDMTRMISIVILILHIYFSCYGAFRIWKLTHPIGDRILHNLSRTGLFDSFNKPKLISLGLLALSLLGIAGKKEEKISFRSVGIWLIAGSVFYFSGELLFGLNQPSTFIAGTYIVATAAGYIFILTGCALLTRILKVKLSTDVFNKEN